ncbi:LB_289 family protein [Marispirochaeta aestuarii]|uniref:LB_289 family protein n=1 Tax=Marispirochaeta aestuarii TaxID=1963862 RepID=UPI0029C8BE6D|nr:hypothetical protein [Marispirochaeta aestuarii]
MKHTDIMRMEREKRRAEKKAERISKGGSETRSVKDFIDELHDLFFYDATKIYNLKDNVEIMELFEDMREEIPEKQWENVLKKAIRKAKIAQKDEAYTELKSILDELE